MNSRRPLRNVTATLIAVLATGAVTAALTAYSAPAATAIASARAPISAATVSSGTGRMPWIYSTYGGAAKDRMPWQY